MNLIDIILDTFVENCSEEMSSNSGKIMMAISFVILYLFLGIGSIFLGFYLVLFSLLFGIIFVILGIAILIFYGFKFINSLTKK